MLVPSLSWQTDRFAYENALKKRRLCAGYDEPGTSSWGGSVIADPKGGLWHMYLSRMAGHCGLNAWQQNSELIHATSEGVCVCVCVTTGLFFVCLIIF
eukprot:COSAG06_NODE_784_length_12328_cov_4.921416_18_plen_98_part_00